MEMLLILLAFWFIGYLFFYRNAIVAFWREPVLRRPILIIESDGWEPGPTGQAGVLLTLSRLLAHFSDADGRRSVMTLGVILATADGGKIRDSGDYHRQSIAVSTYAPLLEAIKSGAEAGVFTIQLHGIEHFWPPALMAASRVDNSVRDWINRAPQAVTEELSSPLQSRWDARPCLRPTASISSGRMTAKSEHLPNWRICCGVHWIFIRRWHLY